VRLRAEGNEREERMDMNMRQKMQVRITNYFRNNDGKPDWDNHTPMKLTPRQAIAEYNDYHPQGATHFTAFEAVDADGKAWTIEALCDEIKLTEMGLA
jgi:hypothetical protein